MTSSLYHKNIPKLDLHGENKESAKVLVKEFLIDNQKIGLYDLVIVHGVGEGILKKEVHKVLKNSRIVKEYKLDNFNSGCTLVKLNETVDKMAKKLYNTQHNSKGER